MALDPRLLAVLACPVDKGPLYYLGDDGGLYNPRLRRRYVVRDGIPVMLPDEAVEVAGRRGRDARRPHRRRRTDAHVRRLKQPVDASTGRLRSMRLRRVGEVLHGRWSWCVTALAVVPQASPTSVSARNLHAVRRWRVPRRSCRPSGCSAPSAETNDVAPLGAKRLATGHGRRVRHRPARPRHTDVPAPWLPAEVTAASDVLGRGGQHHRRQPDEERLPHGVRHRVRAVASEPVNFLAGRTVSNLVLVRPNAQGKLNISLVGAAAGTADVTIDVFGWFSTSSYTAGTPDDTTDERGARLVGIDPTRLVDTRNGAKADRPVKAASWLIVKVAGAPALGTTTPVVVPTPTSSAWCSTSPPSPRRPRTMLASCPPRCRRARARPPRTSTCAPAPIKAQPRHRPGRRRRHACGSTTAPATPTWWST